MMKLFLLFCALAAVGSLQEISEQTRDVSFLGTGGVSDAQPIEFPFNYSGFVNISIPSPKTNMMLCIHWVVPVVVPAVDITKLSDIWQKTCTNYLTVDMAGAPAEFSNIPLRSGSYYFTAALDSLDTNDEDSTGLVDTTDFDFTVIFKSLTCQGNVFGAECSRPFEVLNYIDDPFPLTLTSTPQYYSYAAGVNLAAGNEDAEPLFPSTLSFTIDTSDPDAQFTFSYRLNGCPEDSDDGVECKKSPCVIPNPPFSYTDKYSWGISLVGDDANQEGISANLSALVTLCAPGTIGAECEEYETLDDLDVGEVKPFAKKTILVFNNSVSVAVGGLDGYEQEDVAPAVNVQIDALPYENTRDNVLLSEGAKANTVIFALPEPQYADSYTVLYIDPDNSFGIWKVDETTTCPEGCTNHGTCLSEEYVCQCNEGYEDLDCEHEIKDFTIEYIILIAVGSILILAIVIGVPIYCYLNRKQDYDIVA